MNQLLTIVRLAPWQINDIDEHYKINIASLSFLFIVFSFIRYITTFSGFNLLFSGVLYVVAIFVLFAIGFVIRFMRADEKEAAKLTNRWSTFLIVSFMYSLVILVVLLAAQYLWNLAGGTHNLLTEFNELFPQDWQGLLALSIIIAGASTVLLWTRTHKNFPDFLRTRGWQLAGVLVLALVVVAVVFWLSALSFA